MTLPHSTEHERAVLSGVLLDGAAALSKALDAHVEEDSFHEPIHKKVWRSILWLHKNGKPLELAVLAEELKKDKKLDALGGYDALVTATSGSHTSATFPYSIERIKELQTLRKLIEIADETKERALAYSGNPEDFVAQVSKAIAIRNANDKSKTLEEAAKEAIELCERIGRGEQTEQDKGMAFPWADWNRHFGAATAGELIVLAARPGRGKSSAARQIAWQWSKEYGDVLLFSREMPVGGLPFLFAQSMCGHSWRHFRRMELDLKAQKDFMAELHVVAKNTNLRIFDRDRTINHVTARVQAYKQLRPIKGIVIDYLQRYDPMQDKGETRDAAIGRMTMAFKDLAIELNCPVLLLAQVGRDVERENRPARLSDLRECLCLERTVLFTSHGVIMPTKEHVSTVSLNSYGEVITTDSRYAPRDVAPKLLQITTRSGREVICTPDHLIRTDRGYIKASEIQNEDYAIACIAKLPRLRNADRIEAAKWMGWMLGNGSMCGGASPSFICSCEDVANAFIKETHRLFGLTPKVHKHKCEKVWQYDLTASTVRTKHGNPIKNWLKRNEMWGWRGPDKQVPAWFCETADDASLAALLAGLFETDGSVFSSPKPTVQFSTTSRKLALQVVWALLRLGIYAHLDDGYMSKKATVPCYKVSIFDLDQIELFRRTISLTGRKGRALMALELRRRSESPFGSRLGKWVGKLLQSWMAEHGLKPDDLGYRPQGKRISQSTLRRVYWKLIELGYPLPTLSWFTNGDVYWDAIRSVKVLAGGPVFDRVVPGHHNFVAGGVFVHNSGNIEQDADRVIFLDAPDINKRTGAQQNLNDGSLTDVYVNAIQAKGRGEGQHTAEMMFHRPTTTFRDLAL